ncbi:hypothetical protein AB1L88_20595 [Tautonia sp. JC769]|uniref:hypothetical protein n=1 Tax=Tautonia sp. JC769 TaxID=3232135 RepID=UPI00345B2884
MTKATTAEGEGVRRSLNWAVSRRGILEVREDALACGDWVIPYQEIEEAVLYSVSQAFIPGYVLMVRTRGVIYQFGLNWGRYWGRELPFPVRREKGKLGYSWQSVAVRVAFFGLLGYWLWSRIRGE